MATWRPAAPAPLEALSTLRLAFPGAFQEEYFSYLLRENGGEGDLGVSPGWIQLWSAEQVVDFNAGYRIQEYLPGFVGIGSNGGGELFVVDVRSPDVRPICCVPFIPMDADLAEPVAPDFLGLRKLLGVIDASE